MIAKFKTKLNWNMVNALGWRSKRKIVVIECDDWGSIRSNERAWQELATHPEVKADHYLKYDTLATEEDLLALYDTLSKFKDIKGNHPIITANTIMTNPDFEKIKQDHFQNYHYELFTETLDRYYPNQNVFKTWEIGIQEKLFRPQFHGREHVNIHSWMQALQQGDSIMRAAFELETFGVSQKKQPGLRNNYMATFDFDNTTQLENIKAHIAEGLQLFEKVFGYSSKTLIAPCHVWSNDINEVAIRNKVKGFQSNPVQHLPVMGEDKYKRKLRYTGQTHKGGLSYTIRNAFFEPSRYKSKFSIQSVLDSASNAFRWNKPLIIGTHRVNFVGKMSESNRKNTLNLLYLLFNELLKIYPDIEFMSSEQLINMLSKKVTNSKIVSN